MLLKFTNSAGEGDVYPTAFQRTPTNGGPDRLAVSLQSGQIELICQLLSTMPGPFGFLYILVVTRTGLEQARYELDKSLTLEGITRLLDEYRGFFEQDARHTVFIVDHSSGDFIVYDRHNLIYIYGDLDRYTRLLTRQGLVQRNIIIPTPHAHHYHHEFDDLETRLVTQNKWVVKPLRDQDSE